jgi:hypothetical protein
VESIEQLKVTSVSVLVNPKLTDPLLMVGGAEVMTGVAADRSIFHSTDRVPLTFPALSTALTANVWNPSASDERFRGLVQVTNAAPSREHWYDATSVDELPKEMEADCDVVGVVGCETVGVLGAVRSMVQLTVASRPFFAPGMTARTVNLWALATSPV